MAMNQSKMGEKVESSEIRCEACGAVLFYGEWDICDGCREKIDYDPINSATLVSHSIPYGTFTS